VDRQHGAVDFEAKTCTFVDRGLRLNRYKRSPRRVAMSEKVGQTRDEEPIPAEVQEALNDLAADSGDHVTFDLPAESEIRFLGEPILALNPAANNATLPARFLSHHLVAGRYFFALPRDLWDLVHHRFGAATFDAELVDLEDAATRICGDCSFLVGLRSGRAFTYSLLRLPSPQSTSSPQNVQARGPDVQRAKREHAVQQANARLKLLTTVAEGYVGWLMSNRQFLDEHDALITSWAPTVRRWGFDKLGILVPQGMFLRGDNPLEDPQWPNYSRAFEEFFARWRLQGLAAPYLPIPLQPLMGGLVAISFLPQLMRAGGVFCYPDTFPVPSRDELRWLLEGALRGGRQAEHLEGWMSYIARDNMAKSPIARFGRLFLFQHYYRVLHHRHGRAFRGKSKALKKTIAEYLGVSLKTVVNGLVSIRKRLGNDWLERGRSSPVGPF